MRGICGWVAAGAGGAGGIDPSRVSGVMRGALAHRGHIGWLGAPSDAAPAAVADSSFNGPDDLLRAWSASRGDAAAFAAALNGSFAAAVLDLGSRRLILARDRLGEKPLYYMASSAGVAFASEIKALRAAGFVFKDDVDATALDAFLAFTYIPAPWTFFSHVRKVPAGHTVHVDLDRLAAGAAEATEVTPYWRLPDRAGLEANPAEMLERLSQALERRLPHDGDLSVFLSGGLDSSLVTMLAARAGGSRRALHTWSVSFSEPRLDESIHARRVAGLARAHHHEIPMPEVDPALVSQVLHHLDEPMADAATLPNWVLAREAAGTSAVALTGDGADALLAGDHWFRRLQALDALEHWPRPLRSALMAAAGLGGEERRRRASARRALLELSGPARYLAMREKWTARERAALYTPDFARRVKQAAVADTYLKAPLDWEGGSVDAAIRMDARHGLPEGLLMKGDKMGMAHGVETRSPFVDPEFAAWCARLGLRRLLKGNTGKWLLKQAALELLPRDLVHRRKRGLQVPIGRWLKGPLRDLTEAAFHAGRLEEQGIFDPAAMALIKRRFEAGPAAPALDGKIWQLVAMQTWWAGGLKD
ncbi:MAG: asparagine synthetase B family protein [Candidatus Polarisedimenticolia bacterium]